MEDQVAAAVLGAGESVELLVPRYSASGVKPASILEFAALADSRLTLRAVVGDSSEPHAAAHISQTLREMADTGWQVRRTRRRLPFAALLVDRVSGFVAEGTMRRGVQYHPVRPGASMDGFLRRFDEIWTRSELLTYETHAQPMLGADEEQVSGIRAAVEGFWGELIARMASDPSLLYELTPRKFEELVAELLRRDGLDPQLTPERRDGGRDILVHADTAVGDHLCLVECKRYAPNRPIGVDLVRALYGVVELERATSGLIVTTSSLTAGARDFIGAVQYRMSAREHSDLRTWLARHGT